MSTMGVERIGFGSWSGAGRMAPKAYISAMMRMMRRALPALAWCLASGSAGAAALPPIGLWQGRYVCAQGKTALALQIIAIGPRAVRAVFYFHALASNNEVPPGCFAMQGTFDATTRRLTLLPTRWLARPPFYVWTGLSGTVSMGGGTLTGVISGPACGGFSLVRALAPPDPPPPAACRMEQTGPTV